MASTDHPGARNTSQPKLPVMVQTRYHYSFDVFPPNELHKEGIFDGRGLPPSDHLTALSFG